jgi:acyl carrier protein
MEMSELEGRVCKILAENLSVPEEQVTPAARFQEDLDADSLDLVEAVLALEEEFGVSIPEEEMEGVQTVGQAIQLVASKMGVPS